MLKLRAVLVLASLLFLPGCAAVALSAGTLAASAGVNHTLSGIAYKTFVSPVRNVRLATLKTLSRMDMEVTEDGETEAGWEIGATASDRTIEIELESLTPTTTRMRVVAHKGNVFLRDGATAVEIVIQTIDVLERDSARAERAD